VIPVFRAPCLRTGIADAGYDIGVVDSPLKKTL
jgi:hypothetical protein